MLLCLYYGRDGSFRAEQDCPGGAWAISIDRPGLMRGALDCEARYIVIAHNHPSGLAWPSASDVCATRKLHRMFADLGIALVDHAIVAAGGDVFSFRRAGLI